jgi:hypothetical protein
MATTYNSTILISGSSTVEPLNATAFITINNLGPDLSPLTISWGGVAPPANSILVSGSVTVNAVENSPALFSAMQNSALTILGPVGQQFSIYFA